MKDNNEEEVYKVDLSKPPVTETEPEVVPEVITEDTDSVIEEAPVLEVIEDITNEVVDTPEVVAEVEEPVIEIDSVKALIPEGIQKLVDFMEDTGGDIGDYVKLNTDVSTLDAADALDKYYEQTKSHLSDDERSFLLEETFGFDEDVDSDRDIKKKKIALKEEVAKAKAHLELQKDKYYTDIKAGSKLTTEQKEAVDFFDRYNEDSKAQSELTEISTKAFQQRTEDLFNDEFKGFDFNVGDKKFRYNVKNKNEVKETQSDLSNFVNKFVGEDNTIKDAAGYHKGLFTAMNADALAQHFYEQGKADAVKASVAQSKNVSTEARQTHGETQAGGVKYKALGDSSSSLKLKIKNKR